MDLAKLVTGSEMTEIDRRTISETGILGVELMERAGAEVVAAIAARWDGLAGLKVAVLCGKGNNGGDGFVVARLLAAGGGRVRVFLAAELSSVQGDAAEHLQRYEKTGGEVEVLHNDLTILDAGLAEILVLHCSSRTCRSGDAAGQDDGDKWQKAIGLRECCRARPA